MPDGMLRPLVIHFEPGTAVNQRSKMDPKAGRRPAWRGADNDARVRERCRAVWGARLVDQLRQDLGYAWRGLARNAGFTAAALLTLVISIGASTTMFSLAKAVLLRPLPYQEPDRLVAVWSELRPEGVTQARSGYANVNDWRRRSRSFAGLAVYDGWSAILHRPEGGARRASAMMVSPELFDVLGVRPALGRTFTLLEAERREALAVLSHSSWRKHYAADPAALGSTLLLDGRPVQIIGVAPAGFFFPDKDVEFWVPHTFRTDWPQVRETRGTDSWHVVARLAEGVSLDAARTELAGIAQTLEADHPGSNRALGVQLASYPQQAVGRSTRLAFLVLAAAVAAVQVIACCNLASLLLARAAARQRELAVREALGASHGRLVGQMLVETTLLTVIAATSGTVVAALALRVILSLGIVGIPRLEEASVDATVLLFTIGLAIASALFSGLLPALVRTRRNLDEALRGAGRGLSEGRGPSRVRASLIIFEFALAIVLLMVTGLLLRSFAQLSAVDTGFRAAQVLVVGLTLPPDRPEPARVAFGQQLLERVRALPGVRSAGTTEDILLGLANERTISVSGPSRGQAAVHRLRVNFDGISPDYFRTVGAALLQGRDFSDDDGPRSPPVVIINETLARHLWAEENPLGRQFRSGGEDSDHAWMTVIGVVADLRRQERERPPGPQAFRPFSQQPSRGMNLVVAADLDPNSLSATVRRAIAEIDPSVPVSGVTPLRQILDRHLTPREFQLGLAATFAAVALTLAGVGVFGLMNYAVVQRTQEIGVRIALGAQRKQILRLIIGQGVRLALAGMAVGIAATLVLSPMVRSLFYEVSPFDPATMVVTILVLLTTAIAACYVPARRVAGIDPVTALRADR
jgi:predicted permease